MSHATKLLQQARTGLLLDNPFWGSLALRAQLVEDPSCETGYTNGEVIGYNPEFIEALSPAERKGFLAHEVAHIAHGHVWRRGERDHRKFNIAADHAINGLLTLNGFSLPEGALNDPQYAGMSAEAIYGALPIDYPGNGDDPGGCGEVRDPSPANSNQPGPNVSATAPTQAEWEVAVLQAAAQAKMQGRLPAGLERLVQTIKTPPVHDLTAALLEFAERSARADYSWQTPNTRYLAHGLYLPSLKSEQMPPLAAAIDTSGSITQEQLSTYVEALQAVLDALSPESLNVYACDAEIHATHEYLPGDIISDGKSNFPGGGGTSFLPVFEKLADPNETQPVALVYFTDLEGSFPRNPPDITTLWVVLDPYGRRPKPPFGECIYLPG